ncbi:MAG: hypothetical protein QOI28_2473 [Mycobacterium sp.]|nr:hypothetical protein [Mycobacterium sp.]MDT5190222.1 hypothetical protein [Mycobacterium sp.]
MIQVCSRCATRWNVRDRRRDWCPRCQGALLAPTADAPDQQWGARPTTPALQSGPRTPPRLPQGYRWIAVRPGAAPPPRRGRRPLGPTPRYAVTPPWGLTDHFDARYDPATSQTAEVRSGPSVAMVRGTLLVTMVLLGFAAVVHIARYALLLINRSTLLNPWVAGLATWFGVAASVLALFAIVASVVVLTNWLIGRRARAFAHRDTTDPRSAREMRLGCLVPVVNLFWAPVYLIELADAEGRLTRLRATIVTWWCVWIFSTLVSVFSIATSFTRDAQGIADNTVTTIVAYLVALAALLLAHRVLLGFERVAVDRPVKRWVIVPDEAPPVRDEPEPIDAEHTDVPVAVESEQREPAA